MDIHTLCTVLQGCMSANQAERTHAEQLLKQVWPLVCSCQPPFTSIAAAQVLTGPFSCPYSTKPPKGRW